MNIIKKYWNSAYLIILPLIPALCMCAGLFWTVCKYFGYYSDVSWSSIIIFDCSQIIYMGISIFIIYKNKDNPLYIASHLFQIKCYIMVLIVVQYTFILCLFPAPHTWECTIIFLLITVFFFDTRLQIINSAFCSLSLLINYAIKLEDFFPNRTAYTFQILSYQIVIYSLSVIVLTVIVHLTEAFLIQAQDSREKNAHLLQKQVQYYKQLDLMDQELRRFRHDIKNHFICIEALLEQGKEEELSRYFKDLQQSFCSREQLYYTGNSVTDAVLNYELHRHCEKNVCVTVSGILPQIQTVNAIDICSLFSNMLTNAIHATNMCHDKANQQLTIQFQHGKEYFSISIQNGSEQDLTNKEPEDNNNRNHGHGLYIIKEIVDKYNGFFEQIKENNVVHTTIILPL